MREQNTARDVGVAAEKAYKYAYTYIQAHMCMSNCCYLSNATQPNPNIYI